MIEPNTERLRERIRMRAYYLSLTTAKGPRSPVDDWLAAERVETQATFFFDECGTPATEDVFVVAGYGIYGDVVPVREAWVSLLSLRPSLDRKARKYDDDDMEIVARFLSTHQVLPITSHATLSTSDLDAAKTKIKELSAIADAAGVENVVVRKAGSYVWLSQVALTVGPSMISFLLRAGPVTAVSVHVDQFTLPDALYVTAERLLRRSLDPTRYSSVQSHASAEAGLVRERVRYTAEDCVVDLSGKGKLAYLADAIAAMYSRQLRAGDAGYAPWRQLVGPGLGGSPPASAGRDVGDLVRARVRSGWGV